MCLDLNYNKVGDVPKWGISEYLCYRYRIQQSILVLDLTYKFVVKHDHIHYHDILVGIAVLNLVR